MAVWAIEINDDLAGDPFTLNNPSPSGGDQWLNYPPEPDLYAIVTGVGNVTYTVTTQAPCSFGEHPDLVGTLQTGELLRLGRFDHRRYTAADGLATITFSDPARVQVAVVRPSEVKLKNV